MEDTSSVAALGECMIELSEAGDGRYALGYAGDAYNVAVGLARAGTRVRFVSRVGDDHYSDAMLAAWEAEGVDGSLTDRLAGMAPGLYLIRTDASGERSFTYWRDASPARRILADDEHAEQLRAGLADADWIFLSGITLSLLTDAAHARLLELLDALPAQVAFDTNYRPAGWPDAETARRRMDDVLRRTSIALPTLDDHDEDLLARLHALDVPEAAIKLGADGARLLSGERIAAAPVTEIVDTTGAGDAFDAGYLHARLNGASPADAAAAANRVAAAALTHRGAIAPC